LLVVVAVVLVVVLTPVTWQKADPVVEEEVDLLKDLLMLIPELISLVPVEVEEIIRKVVMVEPVLLLLNMTQLQQERIKWLYLQKLV
jgi:hypothetical protein